MEGLGGTDGHLLPPQVDPFDLAYLLGHQASPLLSKVPCG